MEGNDYLALIFLLLYQFDTILPAILPNHEMISDAFYLLSNQF